MTAGSLDFDSFHGTVFFDRTQIGYVNEVYQSSFYVYGNVSLQEEQITWRENYSNVIRNFNIITTNYANNPLANSNLTLFDQNNTLVWSGLTDSSGRADFNLTFTDSNYTDTMKLEAVKGNFSGASNVSFLSDTPLILTMSVPIPGDLNHDSNVSLVDLVILAQAYGSKPGDSNWNPNADIDGDGIVGLSDLVILAQHYGQHYHDIRNY